MSVYIVYWAKDYVEEIEKSGDKGPFKVVYGSHHLVMPSINSIKVSDIIYPVTIKNGTLSVMSRLQVKKIEIAFDYTVRELGSRYSALIPEGVAYYTNERFGEFVCWDDGCGYIYSPELPDNIHIITLPENITTVFREYEMTPVPHLFHQEPKTCCANLAASGEGSEISQREIPIEIVRTMTFGPEKSKEKPLKVNKNGKIINQSLAGFVRKMSDETMEIFEGLF